MNNYLKSGYLSTVDLSDFLPDLSLIKDHQVAVTECVQEIPCNPCVTSCPTRSIFMKDINDIPHVDFETCIGCGKCVAVCPGLAMFMIRINGTQGEVTLPYELIPLPKKGEEVNLLNRKGEIIGRGVVTKIFLPEREIHSAVVTVTFKDAKILNEVRNIEVIK